MPSGTQGAESAGVLSMRELLKLEKLVHGWLVSRTGLAVLEGVLNKNNASWDWKAMPPWKQRLLLEWTEANDHAARQMLLAEAAKTAALEDAVQLPPGSEPPSVPRSLTLSAGDRLLDDYKGEYFDPNEKFPLESIVAQRPSGQRREYLVKWKDCARVGQEAEDVGR